MSFSAQNLIAKEIFGVDPGISNGSIAKYSGSGYEITPMYRDFNDLFDFWRAQKENCNNPLIFLENITTFSKDYGDKESVGRAFGLDKLKRHYTELRSAIKAAGIPYVEVMAVHWQRYLQIQIKGEDYRTRKKRYQDIAVEMFPSIKVTQKNCDALLLVEFAKRKLKYEPLWVIQKTKKK